MKYKYMHHNYDKLSATIGYVCPGLVLKHSVKLSRKDIKDNKKISYHSEYAYNSTTYSNAKKLASIKLEFNSSLSLDVVGKKGDYNVSVWIAGKHLMSLKRGLRIIDDWFYDPSRKVFVLMEGKLSINNSLSISHTVELYRQKLTFTPIIIERDEGDRYEALQMIVHDERTITSKAYTLDLDEFDMFYDNIKNINLYEAGLALINYLGKPEFGTNLFEIGGNKNDIESGVDSDTVVNGFKSTYNKPKGIKMMN